METAVRLAEQYRGGHIENIHFGHVCGVDEHGNIVYSAGDPEWMAYLRSAAKPFQAIPAFVHGTPEAFGLTDKECTIMTASHRAEPYHVEALESMMAKLGLGEEQLICSPSHPLSPAARDEMLLASKPKRRLYHNCSGKHMGILAYSKQKGYPLEGYGESQHPAQVDVLDTIADMADYPKESIRVGIDGCGFPVHALPLNHIARMFLKLACPDLIADEGASRAAGHIGRLMNEHAEMVSAPWFICSILLKDPNIAAKGGAKGIYGFALRDERIAFALKVLDGSEDAWPTIIASILEQIGYRNQETIDRLYALAPKAFRNDGGVIVGENKAVFRLNRNE
ncbi:asparaginase [Paenibacillus sp. YIM B09110]|uniref:asparaginase n=1 Tax=Paenibacillus sp. YIM B09110 TaxID=3126102 RepID=UPI00301BE8DC